MAPSAPDLWQAVKAAGDQPLEITDPQTNTRYVVVRADVYERLRALEGDDRAEHEAWARLSRQARDDWAKDNPY